MRIPRRKACLALSLAATVYVALPAEADAPADQYGFFNQYTATIMDQFTNLTWQRTYGSPLTFAQAAAYCESLSLDPYPSGWRVPSYKELLTLVDEQPHFEPYGGELLQKAIDPNAFWGTPNDVGFWTSSEVPGLSVSSPEAYTVSFLDGTGRYTYLTDARYVRCVHAPP